MIRRQGHGDDGDVAMAETRAHPRAGDGKAAATIGIRGGDVRASAVIQSAGSVIRRHWQDGEERVQRVQRKGLAVFWQAQSSPVQLEPYVGRMVADHGAIRGKNLDPEVVESRKKLASVTWRREETH
ncbi:MAG: hypothetical protein IPK85_00880 [Gemmatimonadetes bacterium]|nr:hypothetical protein [Gemmatimonadota bacterium]